MAKKRSKNIRVDPDFADEMRKVSRLRLDKGFSKLTPKEIGTAEMTGLLRRTQGYKLSLEELKTKPKKKK